jgi:hypothetical protein
VISLCHNKEQEQQMDKTRVLFLAANPSATNPLKLDEEIRSITEKIRASEHRDSLNLVSVWAVRPDDLLQSFNEYKPRIVHFSGHGSSTGEIILTDNNGNSKPVSQTALKALFKTLKGNIQVVILNACYSRIQAQAIAEFIDCVIGMNTAIGDQAAITFAGSFYRAIGFGRSVQEAYEQGKVALMLEGIPEATTPDLLHGPSVDPAQVFPLSQSKSTTYAAQLSQSQPIATSGSQQIEFLLDNGDKITCEPEPFASGGEGKLYCSSNGKSVVKIYHDPNPHREMILRALLGKYNAIAGDHQWEELLAWPQALVKQPSLGVVLPRIQQYDCKEMTWYLSPRYRELLKKHSPDKLGNWDNYLVVATKMARIIERLEQFGAWFRKRQS